MQLQFRVVLATALALLGLQVVASPVPAAGPDLRTRCTISGTAGPDVLRGTNGRDVICGRGGNDRIVGRGGKDVLKGGGGRDRLTGGPGDDKLDGGRGRDVLDGVDGRTYRDLLRCGPGRDSAAADPPDTVRGDCERVTQDHVPTGLTLDPASVAEGQPVGTPVGTLSVTDPDPGDTATYSLVPGPGADDNATVVVTGDAVTTAEVLDHETQPTLSIRVRAEDSGGLATEQVLSIEVTDAGDAPVAVDDTVTTPEDTDLVMPLTGAGSLAGNDTDPDGDPLTVTAVSTPAHGTATIAGGHLTYGPPTDLCGDAADSFDYTVSDGTSTDTGTVTVDITCVADPPVAHDDTATVPEDSSPEPVDVLGNDTDPDGGPLHIVSVTQPGFGAVAITGGGTGLTYAPPGGYCNSQGGPPDAFTYTIDGGSTATVRMTVVCLNDAPHAVDDTASTTEDTPVAVPAATLLANDTDPEGDPLTVTAVGGATHGTVGLVGTTVTFTPAANYCGPASFDYTVSDGHGGTDTGTVAVTVSCVDDVPVAHDDSATVSEDAAATAVDVLANDVDVEGDAITIGSVTQPAHGTVTITGGGTGLTYLPDANYCNSGAGPDDTFTYTVNGGSSATVSMTVTCVNDAPHAVDDTASTNEDIALVLQTSSLLANDTDPDGDTLTVTAVGGATHGTVGLVGTAVTFTPAANYCGPASYDYTVSDGHGGTDTGTVAVTVSCVNDAPVAHDDSATVSEDAAATAVDVLANDVDVEGDAITIGSVTQPAHGTVTITGGGTGLTYLPDANYCNSGAGPDDTFTYTVNGGSSATVSMTVTCVDDDPTAVNDADTVNEDSGASAVDVLANDTDTDSGPKSITSVTQPAHGAVVITGGGTGLTYAPNANYCNNPPGTTLDTFTYTLTPGGSSATVTMTVTCVDDPPTAVADATTVAMNASATAVDVLANDTDTDGGPKSISSVTQPTNGTVVITGGGTGLTYQPNAAYCNNPPGLVPETFTYTLNGGSSATVSVTVDCDSPPTAVDDADTVNEDSGASAVDVLANDTDTDGGPKSIASVTQPANGAVVITGGGTGLTYAPNADYCNAPPGTTLDTFTYTLTPGGSSATVTMTVTCVDDNPIAANDSQTVDEDSGASAVDVLANDTDTDGGPKSIASVTQPANGTVVITGGGTGLTYAPNADYCNNPPGTTLDTFTYTLTPGGSSATVTMTVTCVNDAPFADDESFSAASSAVGNTAFVVDDPTDGAPTQAGPKKSVTGDLLAGDVDVDGPNALTVVPGTFATADGGSVTLQADGDFVFLPKAGTSCTDLSDSFDYTVTDGNTPTAGTDTGTVTIALSGCVWYVDNTASGDGSSTAPFATLAQAQTASAAGSTIYVFKGDGTTTGYAAGIDLKSSQQLLGEVADLQVGSDLLYSGVPGARPTITDNNADVVVLASGDTVRGFQLDPQGTGGGISGGAGVAGGTIADVRIIDTGTAGSEPGLELNGTSGSFAVSDLVVDSTGATTHPSTATGVALTSAGGVSFVDAGTISITTVGAAGLVASGVNLGGGVVDDVTVTGSSVGGVSLSSTTGAITFRALSLTTTSGSTAALSLSGTGVVTVPGAGTANLDATGGPALSVSSSSGSSLALDTVSSTNSAGAGISLAGLGTGTFTATGGSITGAAGTAFAVSGVGGNGTITYPGDIGNGAGDTVAISGRSGGTVTLSGDLTDDNDAGGGVTINSNTGGSTVLSGATKFFDTGASAGVSLSSDTGHTISFTGGGLVVKTTTAFGFRLLGGGTVNVTGSGNTVTSTAGAGVIIGNATIGSSDVTFEKVSAGGGQNGIFLNNTGSSGRFVVTGNGGTCTNADTSGCSGGTIASTIGSDNSTATPSGTGIVLNNTLNPSFTRMWLHDFPNYAIRGTDVNGFTLASSVVNGTNGDNGTSPYDESSLLFSNLTGSASVTGTYVSGGYEDNVRVVNTSGSLSRITFTNDAFGASGARPTNDALSLETSSGASELKVTITGTTFSSAAGDLLQYNHGGTGAGDLVLTGNTFSNSNPSIATGGGGVSLFQSGVSGGDTTMDIENNTFRDAVGPGVLVVKSTGPATQTGTFNNNTIGVSGVANSGSAEGSALKLQQAGGGSTTWSVTNNTIYGYNNYGVEVLAGGSASAQSGAVNTTITGNTIAQPGNTAGTLTIAKQGIHFNIGTVPGDTYAACAVIGGAGALANTIDASGADTVPTTPFDYDVRLRQRQNTTIKLPGYVGLNNDNTAVQNFINGRNSVGTTTIASNNVPAGGGFTGGASCP